MPKKPLSFSDRVKTIVQTIKPGDTMSYQAVAQAAGNAKAARAVALIMSRNFDPSIPCHRVIKSNGEVGGYNRGGPKAKAGLLALEKTKHIN